MNTNNRSTARLVTLTVLGAAAIVPALLALRVVRANGLAANAERIRAGLKLPAPLGSGAGQGKGRTEDGASLTNAPSTAASLSGDANQKIEPLSELETQSLQKLLAPLSAAANDALAIQVPVRFFSKNGNEQANIIQTRNVDSRPATQSRPAAENVANGEGNNSRKPDGNNASSILPPGIDNWSLVDDGILLTWRDHPAVPAGSILRSEIFRWNDTESPTSVFVTPAYVVTDRNPDSPASGSKQHEYLDKNTCTGLRYSYAVRSIQLDKLEGIEVRRSALGETLAIEVPNRYKFEPLGFVVDGKISFQSPDPKSPQAKTPPVVRLEVTDFRQTTPVPIEIDANVNAKVEIAGRDGRPMGWFLVKIEREEREEPIEVTIPLFNIDGSRKVDAGVAANEKRTELQKRTYPILFLADRCGRELVANTRKPAARK